MLTPIMSWPSRMGSAPLLTGHLVRGIAAAMVLASTLILRPGPADAINDCEAVRTAADGSAPDVVVFKLLLDELAIPDSVGDRTIVHQALLAKLQDNFDKARLELGQFHVVLCLGRLPVNVSDIGGYVEGFTDRNVALETWGVFDGDEAVLTLAVVPLMSDRARRWRPRTSYFFATYKYYGTGELQFLKRLVNTSLEVRLYAAIGAASAAYIKSDFDNARKFFCRSLLMVKEFGDGSSVDPALEEFLEGMSAMVLTKAASARDAGTYNGRVGSLEIPIGTPCGEI